MKYHVREARHSDIAKLTELRVKQLEERVTDLKPEVALGTMRHLNDELGNRVRAWVAELDGEVIGCAFVDVNHGMPRPSNPSGVYGELLGAYILPEHRNHTLGTVLITDLVVDLRGSEFGYIKVDVDERQESFFRRIGFSRHGRELRLRYQRTVLPSRATT